MIESRRVARYDGEGEFQVQEESLSAPDAGEIVIDVAAALISAGTHGSHVRYRRENPDPDVDPRTIGYQSAGKVVDTGPGVEQFEPGDRVVAMGGGYAIQAEYNVVPCNLCTHLPEHVSYEEGTFVHLASTALQGVRRFDPEPGAFVGVIGLGIVGQMTAQLSRIAGGFTLGSDLFELRREKASQLGVEAICAPPEEDLATVAAELTDGYGLDGGYMCFGGEGTEAMKELVSAMKSGPDGETIGSIVLTGGVETTVHGGAVHGNVDIRCSSRTGPGYHDQDFERGEGYPDAYVRWTTTKNIETVVRYLADGRLQVEPLITHRYDLADIGDAYDQVLEAPEDVVGVVITSELNS